MLQSLPCITPNSMWTPQKMPCPRCHPGWFRFSRESPGVQKRYLHQVELPADRCRLQPSSKKDLEDSVPGAWVEGKRSHGRRHTQMGASLQHTPHQGQQPHQNSRMDRLLPTEFGRTNEIMSLPVSEHLPPKLGSMALIAIRKSSLRNGQLLYEIFTCLAPWVHSCMGLNASSSKWPFLTIYLKYTTLFCLLLEPSPTHIPGCHWTSHSLSFHPLRIQAISRTWRFFLLNLPPLCPLCYGPSIHSLVQAHIAFYSPLGYWENLPFMAKYYFIL